MESKVKDVMDSARRNALDAQYTREVVEGRRDRVDVEKSKDHNDNMVRDVNRCKQII